MLMLIFRRAQILKCPPIHAWRAYVGRFSFRSSVETTQLMAPKRGAQPRPSENETTANDPRDEYDVRSPPAKKASARIIAETAAAARPCTHCCTAVEAGATERRSGAAEDRAVATAQSATQTACTAQASARTMAEQQQQQHAAQHIGAHAHTADSNAECATPAARGLRHMMRSAERGRDADRTHQSDREESSKAQQDAAHNPVHTAGDEAHPHSPTRPRRVGAGAAGRAAGSGAPARLGHVRLGPLGGGARLELLDGAVEGALRDGAAGGAQAAQAPVVVAASVNLDALDAREHGLDVAGVEAVLAQVEREAVRPARGVGCV
mmetsp:Transcript_5657/g.18211  ORF Transcript_5657/g.18211 Transcript_5657/m.18211 type:complete len:322 (-) Transcript_5657:1105-2070(-)